jgi:uncharacterized protein YabN with tetrapyrrole methylase and pyrophosphatase domain
MPYIENRHKERFAEIVSALDTVMRNVTVGELNYLITQVVHHYVSENITNYQSYNDVIGALECAKLEMYRRKVAVYEDQKIKENGDVI